MLRSFGTPTKKTVVYFFLMLGVFTKAALLTVSELTMLTLEALFCVYFLSNFNEEAQHVGGAFYISFFLVPTSAIWRQVQLAL